VAGLGYTIAMLVRVPGLGYTIGMEGKDFNEREEKIFWMAT
jgi:hypothetical protein